MSEYTPEKVAGLVDNLDRIVGGTSVVAVTQEAADALTAVTAERDAERERADDLLTANRSLVDAVYDTQAERDRLHKAITEALDHDPLHGRSCLHVILRSALDKEGKS